MNRFEYRLSLRITSKTVDPDEICTRLALTPRIKQRIGDKRTAPNGEPLDGIYEKSFCVFRFDSSEEELLCEMIERVSDSLVPHEALFHRIRDDGGTVEFYIGWFSIGNTSEDFSWKLLSQLGGLKIDLGFDVYGEDKPIEAENSMSASSDIAVS